MPQFRLTGQQSRLWETASRPQKRRQRNKLQMNTTNITINKGEWLSNVMKEIPTNTILNKVMTGCGATTLEINAARHSIIIEPNVPVIIGKKAQHDFLFAVYEGTTRDDVKAYLAGEEDGYRKIITTPEGFDKKVLPAMYELGIPIYEEYFLLFDECEKPIQDVGYRGDIYLPVEDFFKFKGKAMVSATPIIPSDPRFEEQGFEMLRIVPSFDFCKDLTVVITNNTVRVLRKLLDRYHKAEEKVCIFFNSTDTTLSLIQTLKLQGRCKVFCSEKSVRKLKREGFSDVSDNLTELAEINFFTSRFYSAVDIKLDYQPNVIILTDVYHAPYSMIDPQTEVVQAIGRFRNGVARIHHVTNTCNILSCLSRETLFEQLGSKEIIYNKVAAIPTANDIEKSALLEAMAGMDYTRFITREGKRNWFMWDNAWEDEKIRAYYKYPDAIEAAYQTAPFHVNIVPYEQPVSDEDRLRRKQAKLKSTKELWREVIGQLDKLKAANPNTEPSYILEELGEECATMVRAHTILGAKRIEALGYDRRRIEAALGCVEENQLLTSEKMQQAVYGRFHTDDIVPVNEVNAYMRQLISDHGIPFEGRVDRKVIGLFFELEECKKNQARAFKFGKKKYEF